MTKGLWGPLVVTLALTACTGESTSTAGSGSSAATPSRPSGFHLSPNQFSRVLMCGDAVAPRAGTAGGEEPCEQFQEPSIVEPLERELLKAEPAPAAPACLAMSKRLVLTLSDGVGLGFRPPSIEVFADCGLARRPGSDSYFELTETARQLLLRMAAGEA